MVSCIFCKKRHLKPDRKRINIETGETKTIKGNLHYIRDVFGEFVPCCTVCKEHWGETLGMKPIEEVIA